MKRKFWVYLTLVSVLLLMLVTLPLLGACKQEEAKEKPTQTAVVKQEPPAPVKLGAIWSATGPYSTMGRQPREAWLMAVEQWNAKGGIAGHPVELVGEDDTSSGDKAIVAFNKLVYEHKVLGIIGPSNTPGGLAVAPLAEDAGVPIIAQSIHPGLTQGEGQAYRRFVFRSSPPSDRAVPFEIDGVKKLQAKTVAIIHDSASWGELWADAWASGLAKGGIQVVAREKFGTQDKDMSPQLVRIRAAKPDVIMGCAVFQAAGIIWKNMAELGISTPYIGNQGSVLDASKEAATALGWTENLYLAGPKIWIPESLQPADPHDKFLIDFGKAFKERWGQDADSFGGQGYDAAYLMLKALEIAGPAASPSDLRDAIEEMPGMMVSWGYTDYTPTDHEGPTADTISLVWIGLTKDGKWVKKDL